MILKKIESIRREVRMSDVNEIINTVNAIIDKLNGKINITPVVIERKIKDFKFFNGEEVDLPYTAYHTIMDAEDAANVFSKYSLTYKELNNINSLIKQGATVSLTVIATEDIKEGEIKQEINLAPIEAITEIKTTTKKKKKKTSWN